MNLLMIGFIIGYLTNLHIDQIIKVKVINKNYFYKILLNNIIVVLMALIGAFIFSLPTIIVLLQNGIILGHFTKYAISNIKIFLYLVFPHSILEIPAIIIAGAAGFKIPYEIIRYLAGKKEQILTKEDIKEYLTLALISIILIVIAAWIEANVTLKIAKAMLNSTKGI